MIDLSVIIPIYKAEDYIERCARSLMEQTLKEGIEFLFINDCTPDDSMANLFAVIADYPERKHQIRIIENNKNLGVSATRKIGVQEAKGEYIGWCDSDDWVEPETFEKMYEVTQKGKYDIVVAPFIKEKNDGKEVVRFNQCNSPQECIHKGWQGYYFPGSLWQQIIRKEILKKSIDQIVDTNYSEDIFILWLVYHYSRNINYISTPYYHYNSINTLSLVHNINYSWESWLKQKRNIKIIQRELFKHGIREKNRVACNALKYGMKYQYRSAFPNILCYYYTFRECYLDVNTFLLTPPPKRFKTFLVYNSFILFWFYHRKKWK